MLQTYTVFVIFFQDTILFLHHLMLCLCLYQYFVCTFYEHQDVYIVCFKENIMLDPYKKSKRKYKQKKPATFSQQKKKKMKQYEGKYFLILSITKKQQQQHFIISKVLVKFFSISHLNTK